MANSNATLNTCKPGDSTAAAQQVKGNTAQYGQGALSGSQNIKPMDSGSILGTVPPGKTGLKLVDGTVQNNTAALIVSKAAISGSSNEPDNVIPADTATVASGTITGGNITPGAGAEGNVTPNAAQLQSTGKSNFPGRN